MHFRHSLTAIAAFAALALLALSVPQHGADAQRRPGQNFGFYTTTGLVTGDVEAGSVNSSNEFAEVPSFALSGLLTTKVLQGRKSAWIAGVRGTVLSLGNTRQCIVDFSSQECLDVRFTERASLLTGGAFDIRSTILRAMVGPVLYDVEGSGMRVGTQIRLDYAAPRRNGPTPTLFLTRSMLGSQRGRSVGISTFGAGLRWVRRR
ncbi:MAG TPA: hypothetical protein VE869_15765 [Gemmatimonas sp.]|nr:hypothetical protein [Gemmatimonas sp.]